MSLVEGGEIGEWVVADNVGVEDKEWLVVLAENLLGELEWSSGPEGLGLDRECDLDVVCLLVLMAAVSVRLVFHGRQTGIAYLCEVLLHNLRAVVDRKDNVSDTGSSKGLDLVEDHALVSEFNQWLWKSEGLCRVSGSRSWPAAVALRQLYRVYLSTMLSGDAHTSGRRRVPKPPTRMRAGEC